MFETNVMDVINKKLEEGLVEKIIAEQFEKSIQTAVGELMGRWGDVTKVIEKEVKSVLVPYLEGYDYGRYIVKLDYVLTELLENAALENKTILENFKELMEPAEVAEEMKLTELFEHWKKQVARDVDTDGLEIDYDSGEPSYEYVEVGYEVEYAEERSWSTRRSAIIRFECEHDEKMNVELSVYSWTDMDKGKWRIANNLKHHMSALRYLDKFDMLLMKMDQKGTRLILDKNYMNDEVEPDEKPEATWE